MGHTSLTTLARRRLAVLLGRRRRARLCATAAGNDPVEERREGVEGGLGALETREGGHEVVVDL